MPLLFLFRKRLRSAHLLGCKHPHDGSCRYQLLRGERGFKSPAKITKIFYNHLIEKALNLFVQ